MTDKMKMTFIVPVYNVENYLEECLNSLINQTYSNIEIIAVNDGATDSSPVILNKFADRDNRIKVINKANGGLSSARNIGLEYVTGDYVFFVDSDDFIALNSAQVIADKVSGLRKEDYPDMIFFSWFHYYANETTPISISYNQDNYTDGVETLKNKLYNSSLVASVSSKVFSSSFIRSNNLRFIEGIRYEDFYFTVKALVLSSKNTSVGDNLYYYRLDNASSITNTIKEKDCDVLITLHRLHDLLIENGYSELEQSSLWRTRMCAWVCNATFFKYPNKNFWSIVGWKNCMKIRQDQIFRKYLKSTKRTAKSKNYKLAATLIDWNIGLFYIIRYISKKLFPKKHF